MSRERQRTRAAREAAREAEREQARRERAREVARARRSRTVRSAVTPRRRPRRYGALPNRTRAGLVLGVVLVQFLGWQFLTAWPQRLGLLVLSLFAVPIVITLWLSPRSSR